jgi:aminoglycoside phosphotransferase (APT) family kinase protein
VPADPVPAYDHRMNAPPPAEVVLSPGLVRALLADQHPDLAGLKVAAEPFEGFDMAVFRLGEDLAVRLPRHRAAVGSLEAELRWVAALSGHWTFPTQRVLRTGGPGSGLPWRWAVTSSLPGDLAADRPLSASAAPAVGRALAEIHRPAPADAPFNSEQSVRLAEREPVLREAVARLPTLGASRGLAFSPDASAALWARALAAPAPTTLVWMHADLHPFNVISRDGAFGGIIDWSDVSRGDPAVDLGFARLLFPAAAMPAVHHAYGGVDEATAARALGVGLAKAATLATVAEESVADIGWRTLTELGVAQ